MKGSEHAGHLRSLCKEIRTLDVEHVIGVGTPNHHLFRGSREQVRGVIYFADVLETCDFDNIPEEHIKKALDATMSIHKALMEMVTHANSGFNAVSMRDGIINTLRNVYILWFDTAAPIIAFARARGTDIHAMETQIREARDRLTTMQAEAEAIHKSLKDLEVRSVVSKQATFFAEQAMLHKKGGNTWLIMLLLVASVLASGAAYVLLNPPETPKDALALVSQWAPRLVIASILFWGLSLCSRNYRAHRHNEVTNQHRALSLKTFNVFVASAEEPAVRSAILAQAASTIFSAVPSGYSPDQAEPLPHATAVELLQKLAK